MVDHDGTYLVHDADERETGQLVRAVSHEQAARRASNMRESTRNSGELHVYLLPEPEIYLLEMRWEHI